MAATNHTANGLPLPEATDKIARQDILDISNNVEGKFMSKPTFDPPESGQATGPVEQAGGIAAFMDSSASEKRLFLGSANQGATISVPGISKYNIFRIYASYRCVGVRMGDAIDIIGGSFTTSSGLQGITTGRLTIGANDQVTVTELGRINHTASGNTVNTSTVAEIWGVI